MPITLNSTDINRCENTTGWVAVGSGAGLATGQGGQNGVPAFEGGGTVEFHLDTGQTGGYQTPTITAFDARNFEVGAWFLNPKLNDAGNEMIATADSGLRLRLYSGTNWADYYQGAIHRGADGTFNGGWLYLRASGGPGSEDANSGTWGTAQASSVDSAAIVVEATNTNTGKNDLEYQIDWIKYYDKIVVTGNNGGNPYTLGDVFTEAVNNVWGVCNETANFYELFCGIEIGNTGEFKIENEFLYLNHSSSAHTYNISVLNGGTLTLGVKNVQSQATYAENGAQLFPLNATPDFTIASGGVLNCYASLLRDFNTVNLGSGGSSTIDIIKTDFYNNASVEFRSTGLSADDIRIHTDSSSPGNLGGVYNLPSSFTRINVFNCLDALEFRVTMEVDDYTAGDTTRDALVLEGETLTLKNSTFTSSKLERTT